MYNNAVSIWVIRVTENDKNKGDVWLRGKEREKGCVDKTIGKKMFVLKSYTRDKVEKTTKQWWPLGLC